ncbi:50S ribosomal protein L1 [Candidatus Bathyarchaeota archaeon]|nr:50S ribosomal protein L1 [Candidatus Bathyarchaeota archaeon]
MDDKTLLAAIEEAKRNSKKRNFTQTVELIINLRDVDPKKPEERFQELIELPYKPGKERSVCVIASGDMALRAKRSGADLVIEREELEKLSQNRRALKELSKKYDFFIAEASLMPLVGRYLGFALGPKGKMPTPLPPNADIAARIKSYRKTVMVRLRNFNVLRCAVGSEDMKNEEILENIKTVLDRVKDRLKRGIKNIDSLYIKTTMGKPVKVKV